MTTFRSIKIESPLSAFGDLRVTELSPFFQVSFEYTVTNTEIGEITTAGSGAVTQADAMCVVSTGTTPSSEAEWEIVKHAKYRAGLGGLARFTALFTTGVAGTEQMAGLADESGSVASHKNGYAIGYDGATFGFFRWQDDELFFVDVADWDDPLNGNGASGVTIDPTKLNVYFLEFQYLGSGPVNIFMQPETGHPVLVHTVSYANLNVVPSVYNPNFHLMLHADNGVTSSDVTIKSASMAYFIEGKSDIVDLQQPNFSTDELSKTGVTTETALFTIRNKATYAGKVNFIDLVLQNIGGSIEASSANNLGKLRLVKDTTLGGTPAWNDISATDSIVEIDVAGTTLTGGKTLQSVSFAGKNDRISEGSLVPYKLVIAPGESVTVAGSSANSATINGSLLWKELF